MKKRIIKKCGVILMIAVVLLFTVFYITGSSVSVNASGLIDDTIDAGNLYSRYSLWNYQLDFYVDSSYSWLPWNWMDGIGRSVMYGIHCITNVLWQFSILISYMTGYVVQQAYNLNFINDMAESIGKNMQTLAGISSTGFSNEGFFPGFLLLIILTVGIYVAYTGLIKRETNHAIQAILNMLIIFILSTGFIAYAPDYIKNINDFSSDISTGALTIGTKLSMLNSKTENASTANAVGLIRDSLFSIQIYQPWLILQYGTSDIEIISAERIEGLVSVNPEQNYGADREAVVQTEIETYANSNMTVTGVAKRLGMVLFIFLLNIIISIFVFLLTGAMILSQIMFIIYAMFLPVALVLSMFPTYNGMVKKAVLKVFNVIMQRAGITLIITVAFSISSMFYVLSEDYPFFLTAFLQIVTFAGIYLKMGDILSMFSLQEEAGSRRRGSLMRSLTRYAIVRKVFGRRRDGNTTEERENWNTEKNNKEVQNDRKTNMDNNVENKRYKAAEKTPRLAYHADDDGIVDTDLKIDGSVK